MEGCGFRDRYEDFQALNVEIVGIGFATPTVNLEWAEQEEFPYELWSDTDRVLSLHYDAVTSSDAFFPDRIMRLLDEQGEVLLEYNSVDVSNGPQEVLEDCEGLFGN